MGTMASIVPLFEAFMKKIISMPSESSGWDLGHNSTLVDLVEKTSERFECIYTK
jgi:hypothetical protein